jgi:hypothetical protein
MTSELDGRESSNLCRMDIIAALARVAAVLIMAPDATEKYLVESS